RGCSPWPISFTDGGPWPQHPARLGLFDRLLPRITLCGGFGLEGVLAVRAGDEPDRTTDAVEVPLADRPACGAQPADRLVGLRHPTSSLNQLIDAPPSS